MTRKMDRFERVAKEVVEEVKSCICGSDMRDGMSGHIQGAVERVLNKEHYWMRRMIRELQKREEIEGAQVVGYRVALRKVLTRLTQRRG